MTSRQYDRRDVLRGAAVLGVAGPVLWRESNAAAASAAPGPQWIAFGPDPTTEMYVSWATGTASGSPVIPSAPQVRWGPTAGYGLHQVADTSAPVPMPANAHGEPAENAIYSHLLIKGLVPGTTYHYSVSNDGHTWSAGTTFQTAAATATDFRFTAFGDHAASVSSSAPMVSLVASLKPAFHVMPGDLAYSTERGERYPKVAGFVPSRWDGYLRMIGPRGAQSIPWQASVGAHEVEPLGKSGYAGFVRRFPQAYEAASGSPVVFGFRYGNVAVVHLDGNDLSAQVTTNTGYTDGAQTKWLRKKLAAYRSSSNVDFIVAVVNCCCYSTNREHGSDGGLRDVWGPLFDRYHVDLVISGHVHAYERTSPIRAGQPTRHVASGGTVHPASDGTTYICAGGGGQALYRTWYGATGGGDAGNKTAPKVWRRRGGDSAAGGHGDPQNLPDTAKRYSAFRRAVYSCLVIDVTAPTVTNPQTTMHIRALKPAQKRGSVTSIKNPVTMDSVTLVRTTALP